MATLFCLSHTLRQVGIPPSGPFDAFAHRVANRLVGNNAQAAALEITSNGPTLVLTKPTVIAWTGAEFSVLFNGQPLPAWRSVVVGAGTLSFGSLAPTTFGLRAYLAVAGGFRAEPYLGSVASFPGGKMGGFSTFGDTLAAGAELPFHDVSGENRGEARMPLELIPSYGRSWTVGVVPGPQESPDYLTPADVDAFYAATWKISKSASKLGVRLEGGAKFQWARKDGGGGGSHPSNLHDNAYGIGSINFTGDHPVVLGVDGPSLGGFVCPATVPSSELSKFGQMKPGVDSVRFTRMTLEEAIECRRRQDHFIETLRSPPAPVGAAFAAAPVEVPPLQAVARKQPAAPKEGRPGVQYRVVGDSYILVEYGEMVLDLNLRIRVHKLDQWLAQKKLPGLIDRIPGVRTLLLQYDSQRLSPALLLKHLEEAEHALGDTHTTVIPSRILRLPMAFKDKWTGEAVERYATHIRTTCRATLTFWPPSTASSRLRRSRTLCSRPRTCASASATCISERRARCR
jgi:urea carboxylase